MRYEVWGCERRGERREGGTDDRSPRGPDQDWGKDELGLAGWDCLVPGSWTATLHHWHCPAVHYS